MKKVLDYLEQLEFSKIEADLYLLLLKSGLSTVADLAQAAHINRTAAYGYIHSLLQKGVIAKVKGSVNKIVANPPEHLRYLVEQKANSVKSLEMELLGYAYPNTRSIDTEQYHYRYHNVLR